jgi:NAD+-dependent protein deacetylase sirtuin 2
LGDNELLQVLAAHAASRGIPLEYILSQQYTDDDEDVEYPFDELPRSLADVAAFINSDKCRRVLVLTGAGQSCIAGIPDFRSADGLYATLQPEQLTATLQEREAIRADPTLALEQNMFLQNPLPLLELQRDFILGTRVQRWKATLAHRFLEMLSSKGKLVRIYTQNIDGLEDQCSNLRNKVIAVHGSMDRAECAKCGMEADFAEFCDKVQSHIKDLSGDDTRAPSKSRPISCQNCGENAMKPAIVLFRSSLPKKFFECIPRDAKDVDLLIVIGTSLRVAPANSLVWRVPRSAMRVLINRESAGTHLGMQFDPDLTKRDYFAQGDCDAVVLDLMCHLGWVNDLEPLLADEKLPERSAQLLKDMLNRRKAIADAMKDEATQQSAV